MLYLKINEKIRELIDLVKDSFKLGCKDYCKFGLIALDEFELLRKELAFKNLFNLTDQEYKEIIKSTESVYFHNIHLCTSADPIKKIESLESESDTEISHEEVLKRLKEDKVASLEKKKEYFSHKSPDYFDSEFEKKKEEESLTKSEILKIRTENTLTYALSMVGSFFLLAFGSYYLGKYILGFNDSNNLKLVLVISIITLICEMVLFVLKMNKEDQKNVTFNRIKESSFAYKFNKKYREKCILEDKKKVYPFTTKVNSNKSKVE
jgi:hypothetical protein